MLDQEVHILGSVYTVATPKTKSPRAPHSKQQDDLHDLYYLDIVGTRYEFDDAGALSALRRLKTRPLFITRKVGYTEPQTASKPHVPIWRVYFRSTTQLPPLLVNGRAVDQIVLHGVHYGVFVKDFVRSTTQRQGRMSPHCINLDLLLGEAPSQENEEGRATSNKRSKTQSVDNSLETTGRVEHIQSPPTDTNSGEMTQPTNGGTTEATATTRVVFIGPHELEEDETKDDATETARERSSQDEFHTIVDHMEVEEFIQPNKTAKRTRSSGQVSALWVNDNMYDVLNKVEMTTR
ncbi:Aste57867_4913 [Aphanomyces stellatus]|uniref:Aste57867_4913 protein n=1 Tax=Aphanomyces stellatus TaxID=120398 RepID=A0A485KGI0_9STRA|nr:hypothetical protein As57867_004900 [Aphanomyces stellatus]VFT82004.1 Aste57867_4913 [Aphanomyces stellatus]